MRQIVTDVHPLVEMTLMHQKDRTLLHLVNLSGHSQTGYFSPIPMRDIRVKVAGSYRTAKTVRSPGALSIQSVPSYSEFVVPQLRDYELVVLQ